jgi:hypothetical protein
MEKYCQNPLCEFEAIKEVPVSAEKPGDGVRALCAACEETYAWGVQHGRMCAEAESRERQRKPSQKS